MEFGRLMTDIPVYVSCKIEIYISKSALYISEYVRIAFLYVLSTVALVTCKNEEDPIKNESARLLTSLWVVFRRSRAANSAVGGVIRLKFTLIIKL